MKSSIIHSRKFFRLRWVLLCLLAGQVTMGQDTTEAPAEKAKLKPVKNTFESIWIIDDQTTYVPIKGTFEFDIQHRFGTWNNGYSDFFGLFASSNIRLGVNYSPYKNLNVGLGFTKYKLLWDGNVKYLIFQQTSGGGFPVSLAYYGNMAIDTRPEKNFVHFTDRLSYFNQLIISRKVTSNFSVQVSPSLSHTNVVNGYYSDTGKVSPVRNHNHFAIAFMGRYKISPTLAVIVDYDQPITKHKSGNPHPNIAIGLEANTSSHTFQLFAGQYYYLSPQQNNMYNQNDYKSNQWLIGFNITRLWNF